MSSSKPESPSCKKGDNKKAGAPVKGCPRGTLLVIVKDAGGSPVRGVEVSAGSWGKKLTDKKGRADFGKLPAGKNTVVAKKSGHAPKRKGKEGGDEKKGVSVKDGDKVTVKLVQHPLCASVSYFEGSRSRSKYYGFDHKTNRVAKAGKGEYWLPTPSHGSLSAPGSKLTRDGARWVSVGVGKQTEVEIRFAFQGKDCIPCIKNSSFKVSPASVADVVTKSISRKKAKFKIKGKSEGEASLKVICEGEEIGWFHIWCKKEATIKIDVVNVITTRAAADPFDLKGLKGVLGDIFRQALIKVDMVSLGDVDLRKDAKLAKKEAGGYPAGGGSFDGSKSVLNAINLSASKVLDARKKAPLPRTGAYRIYRYIPTSGADWGGMALGIGDSTAFAFMSDSASAWNSLAHEFGHCLGLRHPRHDPGITQYPAHNHATENKETPATPATNTEPGTAKKAAKKNVMGADPMNLMGYWSPKTQRKYLRYHQWKACSRS